MKNTLLALTLLLAAAGCQSVTPARPYVTADRSTKSAVEGYLGVTRQDHPDLDAGIADLLESWEIRLRAAEAANAK